MAQRRVTWKGLRLVACLTLPTVLGFGAARAIAEAATPLQVTLPTTTSLTVTLPVATVTVETPTTVQAPTTAPPPSTEPPPPTEPVPTTAPLSTTVQPTTGGTVTQEPSPTPAAPVASPSGTATPSTSSTPGGAAATGSGAPAAQASPAAVAGVEAARLTATAATAGPPVRGGMRIVKTGRRERRLAAIGFRLPRPARIVAVFRGPAPSCEVAYTFRGRGRPGANRVPASALVRKGIVETGVYAVRVVAVRGERRLRVGEIVVALRRLGVRRLWRERHRCRSSTARGFLAAVAPMLGPAAPSPEDGESRPADRSRKRPARPAGVAAAPEIQLPVPSFVESSGAPTALFYGAIAIVLFALAGIGVSVLRTLRSQGDTLSS